ncbi:MAG: hypothetical protein MUE52_04985 [Tabrizicola sp.]|nr:hypothetical protein [Tabrizicola sp.]
MCVLMVGVFGHQFVTSQGNVLSPWKGGGFGMYTQPHGIEERAAFLVIDGNPLRLAPADPEFLAWVERGDPASAAYVKRMMAEADRMRSFPRAAQAERLMAAGSRLVWDKALFGTWTDVGPVPVDQMSVTVIEVVRRPSTGTIETRVVFSHAGG